MSKQQLGELGFSEKHQQTVEEFLKRGAGLVLACGEDNSELVETLLTLPEKISPNRGWWMFDMRRHVDSSAEKFDQVLRHALRSAHRLMLFPKISTENTAVGFSRIGECGMLGAATIDAPTCQEAATKFCKLVGYPPSTPILLTRRVQNPKNEMQIQRLAYSAVQLRETELFELKTEIDDCNSIFSE
ncbi:MAG: hypothetical protein K1Y36_28560 [Blastocatellia bacterium]|nr:hypothetical protein [Blastocatellia bacterium]